MPNPVEVAVGVGGCKALTWAARGGRFLGRRNPWVSGGEAVWWTAAALYVCAQPTIAQEAIAPAPDAINPPVEPETLVDDPKAPPPGSKRKSAIDPNYHRRLRVHAPPPGTPEAAQPCPPGTVFDGQKCVRKAVTPGTTIPGMPTAAPMPE